jgi:pilus assembly protein CpaB
MNNKALTMALIMAVLAVFFVQSYVSSVEEDAKRRLGTEVIVVRAAKDIKENETINSNMLTLSVIPKQFAEPTALVFSRGKDDPDTRKGLAQLDGMVAAIPIKKGEQITYNKVTEAGLRTGLSPQVTPGRRAMAVPVSDVTSVSRLVKPGDRVDVIGVIDMGDKKTNRIAKNILQDVLVLSVGKNVAGNIPRYVTMDGGKEKVRNLNEDVNYGTVTIEVDPQQAIVLTAALANNDAGITLALRNNDDTERAQAPAIGVEDLLGADSVKLRRPAQAR